MPVPQGAHAWRAITPQPGSEGSKVLLRALQPIAFAPCGTEEPGGGQRADLGWEWGGAQLDLAQTPALQADGLSQGAKALPPPAL